MSKNYIGSIGVKKIFTLLKNKIDQDKQVSYTENINVLDNSITVKSIGATKDGKTVHLWIYFSINKDVGELDLLFLLPTGFRPYSRYFTAGVAYEESETTNEYNITQSGGSKKIFINRYCLINSNGYISGRFTQGESIMVDTTYMVY